MARKKKSSKKSKSKKSKSKKKKKEDEEEEVEAEVVKEEEMVPEEEEKKEGVSVVGVSSTSDSEGGKRRSSSRSLPMPKQEGKIMKKKEGVMVGIDLGTYQTCFSASNGTRDHILSVMGWPKDPISKKFIGKDVVFGEEVMKKKLALEVYHPIEELMFNADEVDSDALDDFLTEIRNMAAEEGTEKVHALICVPSKVPKDYLEELKAVAEGVFTSAAFIAAPFTESIALDEMHALVVDIGASTVSMARIYGSLPADEDLETLHIGSRLIDEELTNAILSNYEKAQITTEMAREWKELHGYIGRGGEKVNITLPIEGVPTEVDITSQMESTCNVIVEDIVNGIRELIATFDPEFQELIRDNVILTGNGSQIKGLAETIEKELEDMRCRVRTIKDPMFIGADGGLRILQDVPELLSQ